MKRPMSIPRNQLALHLEPKPRHPLDAETHEALITALADLLLEAYAVGEDAQPAKRGCDESLRSPKNICVEVRRSTCANRRSDR